jgi:hypothetical protein
MLAKRDWNCISAARNLADLSSAPRRLEDKEEAEKGDPSVLDPVVERGDRSGLLNRIVLGSCDGYAPFAGDAKMELCWLEAGEGICPGALGAGEDLGSGVVDLLVDTGEMSCMTGCEGEKATGADSKLARSWAVAAGLDCRWAGIGAEGGVPDT